MADDSELDYLKTFIGEVTTSLTVNSYEDERYIGDVAGEKKCLIMPPEFIGSNADHFFIKRYKLTLCLENEPNMMSIINEIVEGIHLYNTTRAGLTSVGVMCNLKFVYGNKGFVTGKGRWIHDIFIDVEWATS